MQYDRKQGKEKKMKEKIRMDDSKKQKQHVDFGNKRTVTSGTRCNDMERRIKGVSASIRA